MLPIDLMSATESVLRRLSTHYTQVISETVPHAHTITLTTAMVEAYVDDLLRALIADSKLGHTTFGGALLNEMRDGFHNSWKSRYGWLDRGFGISIAGSKERQEFEVLVELRNALAHGDGNLSARQKSSLQSMVMLESQLETTLHVQARGGGLRLTAESAVAAILVCRRLTLSLDRATRSGRPSFNY